ncbi:MAG: PEP-CTERM sorting domain-containing protein [Chitinophagaceae bacterium]|nr:MAG: PEP-CTERM sorting domain-containing protein [Chitinophagaceae bacterium]
MSTVVEMAGKSVAVGALALLVSFSGNSSAAVDVSIENTRPELGTSYAVYSSSTSLAQTFKAGFTQILTGIELTQDTWSGPLVDADFSLYRVASPDTPVGALLVHLHLTPQRGTSLIDFTPFQIELKQGEIYSLVFESPWANQNGVAFTPGNPDADWHYADSFADGMMWSKTDTSWAPFASWISRDAAGTSDILMKTYGEPVSAPVPEPGPSTMVLTGMGLLGLSWVRKKSSI